MLDLNAFDVLSFDCYGTLIDWERGIVDALAPVFDTHHVALAPNEALQLFGQLEYSRPLHLVALPDGRTLIQDPGNARFLEVGADAVVKGAWSLKAADGTAFELPPRSIGLDAWGSDRLGRLYFKPFPKEVGTTIYAAIVRLDPGRAALDTVAAYTMPQRTGAYTVSSPKPEHFVVQVHVWSTHRGIQR